MEKALAPFELTPPQFSVMTMLKAYPGHSNADLARLALLTPQTVSVIVRNLERADILARRPHDFHGRIQHLELTEKGLAILHKARFSVHALDDRMLEGLTAEEERIVRRWLVAVATPEKSAASIHPDTK